MVNAHDVAAYVLGSLGSMTTMKLQKLLYYCQAWSLVWDERPLFDERIEAWANGPVVREVYEKHRGVFQVSQWRWGNAQNLDRTEVETVEGVVEFYGKKSAQWLSDLTHKEDPWIDARRGVPDGFASAREITHAAMNEYYSGLEEKFAE